MSEQLMRREFLKIGAGTCALCMAAKSFPAFSVQAAPLLISPGCRTSKVRVGKIYLGPPAAHWPHPKLDLNAEIQRYEEALTKIGGDVEFVGNKQVSKPEEVTALKEELAGVDGILAIHLTMGIRTVLKAITELGPPTMVFAAPYSGHDWVGFGQFQKDHLNQVDFILSSDLNRLAEAIHPFRAIHHLREAKILNLTERALDPKFLETVKNRFGTQIQTVNLAQMMAMYNSIPDEDANAETECWMKEATQIVEPDREEIFRSCKLALAFEKLLDQEKATVVTADCYGSMYHQLPAFPCIGFTRLNDMGYAGICESDLECALTFVLFQGLCGRPGFISDPTMDGENIILAHCMGTRKMDGPAGEAAPYKLRTIMERQEGAVPQVKMRVGEKVTQARLVGTDKALFFTGEIVDAPDIERGCRTKIAVKVDGDAEYLWRNWSHGLHRVTCYGNIEESITRFCNFKQIQLVKEARSV